MTQAPSVPDGLPAAGARASRVARGGSALNPRRVWPDQHLPRALRAALRRAGERQGGCHGPGHKAGRCKCGPQESRHAGSAARPPAGHSAQGGRLPFSS